MPEIRQIEVFPRLAGNSIETPPGIYQHKPQSGRITYSLQAIIASLRMGPDLVYCGHAFMAPLAAVIARMCDASVVSHVHGLEVWRPLGWAIRRSLAASDLVLCVSKDTAQRVIAATGIEPPRCAVILNTVDERFVPADRDAARKNLGVLEDEVVLATVSRLDSRQRHKGHDRVISLLSELREKVPAIRYLIAGTGDDRERLEGLAREQGVEDLVRFLGYVDDNDLPDLYRAADLYVMPSHGEGFGIAFVEAMACGTAAIGLNAGGAECALRHGELGRAVAEAEFPNALSDALTRGWPDRGSLAKRTREIFGRPHYEARLATVFSQLLAERQN